MTPTCHRCASSVCRVTDWHGCYESGWKGVIVDEAFAHPAKFARGLIERIVDHGLREGYWKPGELLSDPFGGVGLGGLVAASKGLRWVGVELELRFQRLGSGYDCPGMTKAEWVRWFGRWERCRKFCPTCQSHARDWYTPDSGEIPSGKPHRFVGNFDLHRRTWEQFGDPLPVLVQGDSREFARIVGEVAGCVTSPPYAQETTGGTAIWDKKEVLQQRKYGEQSRRGMDNHYGKTPGQIGALKAGTIDGAITSPPYAESVKGDHKETETAEESRAKRNTAGGSLGQSQRHGGYGATKGNIGNLKEGAVDAVVTSPPYASAGGTPSLGSVNKDNWGNEGTDIAGRRGLTGKYSDSPENIGNLKEGTVDGAVTSPPYAAQVVHERNGIDLSRCERPGQHSQAGAVGYGKSDGQIGNTSAQTYWEAMRQVYAQMHLALKPGGVCACVVKDYVKNKARVPLCDDTVKLLESIGFHVFERTRAWVVTETREPGLFGDVVKKKSRKSFFRRLAEAKGSPAIDWEEVIWCHK